MVKIQISIDPSALVVVSFPDTLPPVKCKICTHLITRNIGRMRSSFENLDLKGCGDV
jgi:hypothetical protein